jgi:hypothetical protein
MALLRIRATSTPSPGCSISTGDGCEDRFDFGMNGGVDGPQ